MEAEPKFRGKKHSWFIINPFFPASQKLSSYFASSVERNWREMQGEKIKKFNSFHTMANKMPYGHETDPTLHRKEINGLCEHNIRTWHKTDLIFLPSFQIKYATSSYRIPHSQ